MAKVMDQPLSEEAGNGGNSDNEEINKLFPRCRPRVGGGGILLPPSCNNINNNNHSVTNSNGCTSDFNQNSLLLRKLSASSDGSSTTVSMDKANDNYALPPPQRPGSGLSEAGDPPPPAAEDHSVTSGYDYCDYDGLCGGAKDEDSAADGGSVGYPGFCRIEIAGGREIFSKSRSKAAKKRHDESAVVTTSSSSQRAKDPKRFSADVMYDDKLRRYMYNMCSPSGSVEKLHQCSTKYNRTADSSSYIAEEMEGEEKGLRTNGRLRKSTSARALDAKHLVYEAPVSNAEVVYDDIGELMDQRKVGGRNGLHVKDYSSATSSYPIEVLESPGSDTAEQPSFRMLGSSSHHHHHGGGKAPHIDVSSPVSSHYGSGGLWGGSLDDGGGDEEEMMMMEEEEMETDSEPVSPVKQGIARLIGNVPIAEYEGSPRRYGPRPGYPLRVAPPPPEHQNGGGGEKLPSTCEELLQVIAGNKLQPDSSCEADSPPPPPPADSDFSELDYRLYRVNTGSSYVGRRLASSAAEGQDSPQRESSLPPPPTASETAAMVNGDAVEEEEEEETFLPNEQELLLLHESVHQHTTARLLQTTTSSPARNHHNNGSDLDSLPGTEDLGETEVGEQVDHTRNFTLSPETTDCDSNDVESDVASLEGSLHSRGPCMPVLEDGLSSGRSSGDEGDDVGGWTSAAAEAVRLLAVDKQMQKIEQELGRKRADSGGEGDVASHHDVAEYLWRYSCNSQHLNLQDVDLSYFDVLSQKGEAGQVGVRNNSSDNGLGEDCPNGKHGGTVSDAIKEIKQAIQMSKNVQLKNTHSGNNCDGPNQPVWVPRLSHSSKSKDGCHPEGHNEKNPDEEDCDTDQETDRLLGAQRTDDKGFYDDKARNSTSKKKSTSKEVLIHEPAVLIEGVLFRARYLGSTQLVCEGQPTKATRMMQAEEAVSRIKAPEGETQPSTEVDLFISTEKIMVLNTDLKEIMMDHALRAISYIADIGDLVVLMARRRVMNSPDDLSEPKIKRTPKMICHVFESEEAQFIAQSIGQAFQVAYMEFLKANGIEDSSFVKEMDYQEVLNSQEIFGNELEMFAKKEKQKEVVVPKQKGEILGMVIVESGWGSMLPTVVIANMAQSGPAARCGQLNIGDQIIAINGISLVGLPLSTCQNYIKNTKNQTVVKLTVVPCAPVVEVKIKRPDTKYQLGFSVQNGVICSLLRGGIAERGGVRVGHRIIEINGQSVVAVPHEKIVNLLATSVGEIHMKTMPTSMFRLLTGQESPLYI